MVFSVLMVMGGDVCGWGSDGIMSGIRLTTRQDDHMPCKERVVTAICGKISNNADLDAYFLCILCTC